jgi:hypothetical protein
MPLSEDDFEQDPSKAVSSMAESLDRTTLITRVFGIVSLLLTATNLGLLALIIPSWRYLPELLSSLAVALPTLAVVSLGLHEHFRKRGDGYFQELSDMLHIIMQPQKNGQITSEVLRPVVQRARVSARSFSSAAELAFVRGSSGPPVYATLNLIMLASTVAFRLSL